MAEKLLTDRQCKAARAYKAVCYKSDGNGLRLQVRPDGAKYWLLRYTLGGKESTTSLGRYPEVGLVEAREKATEARRLIAEGIRPSVERKVRVARNIARSEATFEAVAKEWLTRNKRKWSAHHHERNEGLLRRILFPELGALPISEIGEQMLLGVLSRAYDSGIMESARRARGVAAQVFDYAKHTHRADSNPARALVSNSVLEKPGVRHFAALKPEQIGELLRKLDHSGVEPVTRTALLLMLYTGLRDFSLRAARWREIDLDTATWTVPSERRKRKRTAPDADKPHVLPLPRQAVAILEELARLTRSGPDAFVFKSHGKAGFLAENTLRIALHRLGFQVTAHGFRSLLTDLLNERGFNPDAVERQLDHIHKDKVRAAYLRSEWLDYRRNMMQWVADWADAQRASKSEPKLPSNVVTLLKIAHAA